MFESPSYILSIVCIALIGALLIRVPLRNTK